MFYTFHQNNSGGSFSINDYLNQIVIIEAKSVDECLNKARDIGIYFNGVSLGIDCGCCGDRWYMPSEQSEVPTVYRERVEDSASNRKVVIHYLNGEVKKD